MHMKNNKKIVITMFNRLPVRADCRVGAKFLLHIEIY